MCRAPALTNIFLKQNEFRLVQNVAGNLSESLDDVKIGLNSCEFACNSETQTNQYLNIFSECKLKV